MSEEIVETFKRAIEAYNRRDIDAFLNLFDSSVETHPLLRERGCGCLDRSRQLRVRKGPFGESAQSRQAD